MDAGSVSNNVSNLPAAFAKAQTDLQQKLLAVNATQQVQAMPSETLMQVLALLGYGANFDTYA